jgi:hypothetical protein
MACLPELPRTTSPSLCPGPVGAASSTAAPPRARQDSTLVDMVRAARRLCELLHGAPPDEVGGCVALLPLDERHNERRFVESELAGREGSDRNLTHCELGRGDCDDIAFVEVTTNSGSRRAWPVPDVGVSVRRSCR